MKTGLVLEGGGMRGLFTAGVLDVMMEAGLRADGAVGVSAGATFGCNFKSRQIGRVLRYNTRYCSDPRYVSFRSLLFTGDLFGADFCYRELPRVLDPFDSEAFARDPMEFHVVCTDVATGEAVYHRCERGDDEDIEWMRASASMPLVSRVVRLGGRELLDGGVADSIPIAWMRRQGFARNVVVLTQPEGFRKSRSPLAPVLGLLLPRRPALVRAMRTRHENYNRTLDELGALERAGEVLVVRPDRKIAISRTERDPERLRWAYAMGREVAAERLSEIRGFLA